MQPQLSRCAAPRAFCLLAFALLFFGALASPATALPIIVPSRQFAASHAVLPAPPQTPLPHPTPLEAQAVARLDALQSSVSFEANLGQWDREALYRIHAAGMTSFVAATKLVMDFTEPSPAWSPPNATHPAAVPNPAPVNHSVLLLHFLDANPTPLAIPGGLLGQQSNYFLGNDPLQWITNVPHFTTLTLKDVWPGIDLSYHGAPDGRLKYDFIVHPGADSNRIQFMFEGHAGLWVEANGTLSVQTSLGIHRHGAPLTHQDTPTGRIEVPNRYVVDDESVGFAVGEYDAALPLVIDPLVYSTYLGGSNLDFGFGLAVDASGNAYVGGYTSSTNYPTTTGAYQTTNAGNVDAYVAKFNPTGTGLVYASYLGGSGNDGGYGIAIDAAGSAYLTGYTGSSNYPTTSGAYQTALGGDADLFVSKLSATGSSLVYSTYVGGSLFDEGYGLAVDAVGNAYVSGQTLSANYPTTTGAYQTTKAGAWEAMVSKIDPTGSSLVYSTYLGGSGNEAGFDVAVDSLDNAYVTGYTISSGFPTTPGAYQTVLTSGTVEIFLTKLNPSGTGLVYSSRFGGSSHDFAYGLAIDSAGNAYVTGLTYSVDFPTLASYQATLAGLYDGFALKLNPTATSLVYATYLGGNDLDFGFGLLVDDSGNAYVGGSTSSSDYPTTAGAQQSTHGGNWDAVVSKLDATGAVLAYSTYLGGGGADVGYRVAVDDEGRVSVAGYTQSANFPTTGGAHQTAYGGAQDAFVSQIHITGPSLDGFTSADYQAESPTGNTPFGGSRIKPTLPTVSGLAGSVSLAVGEFVASFPLLHASNPRGKDLLVEATYRSIGNPGGHPALGAGWSLNWLQSLEAQGSNYHHHTGDGRTLTYTPVAGGAYEGPPGSYAKLVSVSGKLELQDRDGLRRVFDPAKNLQLTDEYDAAGNHWVLAYNAANQLTGLTDPVGRSTTFAYTGTRLVSVTDFAGRTATLQHQANQVVALHVQGPSSGTQYPTKLSYDGGSRLRSIEDAQGNVYLDVTYDEAGRVWKQTEAGQARFFFEYNHPLGLTRVWDGSNEVEWNFLHPGATVPRVVAASKVEVTRGLRPTDPAAYVTQYTHNSQDEVTRITHPAGNSVSYTYDEAAASVFSRGNLLKETRFVGPLAGSDQASLVTQYEHDSTYNVVTKVIDSRGTDSSYVPPNGGAQSAARYTTRVYYDFEEVTLGDLNGDGVTTQANRRIVKVEHPIVNPTGSAVHAAFSGAYSNQARVETFVWNNQGQLTKHTDAQGVQQTRSYYSTTALFAYLQSVTQDGAAGGLGLLTTYAYTPFGVVNQTTDPLGNVRMYDVDLRGRITQEIGPAPFSYRLKYAYDKNDNVVQLQQETDAGSNVYTLRTYGYDALNRLVNQTIHADRSATIAAALAAQGTAPPESYSTQYAYDVNGNRIQQTKAAGGVTAWVYDERGLLFRESGPGGGVYAYDANGNLAGFTDQRGNRTVYVYDGFDRLVRRVDALGSVFWTNHDPAGNVVRERVLAASAQVLFDRLRFHDEANQAYRVDAWHSVPAGASKASTAGTLSPGDDWVTTLREHDARGLVTRLVNDNAHATAFEYDAVGRLKKSTDAIGNTVESTHDENGNVLTRTETVAGGSGACPQVCTTTYTYDEEDRVTVQSNPDSTTRQSFYDGRGNLVKTVDEAGNEVRTYYDDADRPWLVRHKLDASTNVETTTHWDAEDRVVKKCDDADGCTAYTYVPATQLVASESPATLPGVVHGYDANGNRVRTVYGNGKEIRMNYDALNRRISVDVTPDAATIGTLHQSFAYDALGRITQATDNGIGNLGSGVVTALTQTTALQQFDTLGRVVTESQNYLTVHHTRDGVGNVVASMYPTVIAKLDVGSVDPNARVVSRSYDANERLDRVWDVKGLVADYAYEGARVSEKDFGGPSTLPSAPTMKSVVTYDTMQRASQIDHKDAANSVLAGFKTRYDSVGNRVAEERSPATASSQSQLFTLDNLYRTTAWKRGSINAALTDIASPTKESGWGTIDGRNEWASWTPTGPSGLTCSRSTTTANDLQETCGTNPTKTYDRDANGNLADDGTFLYKWDFLNRLVRVENKADGKLVVGYGYDAFDRRVVKVYPGQVVSVGPAPPQQGTQEAWYTYAGEQAVQESRPPSTLPAGPSTSVHVIRQWTYGSSIDEVLEMSYDSNDNQRTTDTTDPRHYYAYDALGTVVGLTNEAGHLVEGYVYQPYGAVEIRTPGSGNLDVKWDNTDNVVAPGAGGAPVSPSGNVWFFTGRQLDPETGTYYYRARQYNPYLGQFISMDPIGVWGDAANLGNPYAYVGNNPGSMTDPSGRCPWCLAGALIGAAGGAVIGFGGYTAKALISGESWDVHKAADYTAYGLIAGALAGGTAGAAGSAGLLGGGTAAAGGSLAGGGAIAGTVAVAEGGGVAASAAAPALGQLSFRLGGAAIGCGLAIGAEAVQDVQKGWASSLPSYAGNCAGGAIAGGLYVPGAGYGLRMGIGLAAGVAGGVVSQGATQLGNLVLTGNACRVDVAAIAESAVAYGAAGVGSTLLPEATNVPRYLGNIYDTVNGAKGEVAGAIAGAGLTRGLHLKHPANSCANLPSGVFG